MDHAPDPQQLLDRFGSGDETALSLLWHRVSQRLARSLGYELGRALRECSADIDDALQATFVEVLRQLRAGALAGPFTEQSFLVYLRTVALHVILGDRRKQQAKKRGGGRVLALADVMHSSITDLGILADTPGPTTVARVRELAEQVERAVLDLPQLHRRVFDLRANLGVAFPEIAAELGSTVLAVRARFFRAQQQVRARVGAWVRGAESS